MSKLKTQLRSIKKQGQLVSEYLLQNKEIVDSLAAVGALISIEGHVELILLALTKDYNAFITYIVSRSEPYSVVEIEALLMDQEERIERFRKTGLSFVQANVAQLTSDDNKIGGNFTRGHGWQRPWQE